MSRFHARGFPRYNSLESHQRGLTRFAAPHDVHHHGRFRFARREPDRTGSRREVVCDVTAVLVASCVVVAAVRGRVADHQPQRPVDADRVERPSGPLDVDGGKCSVAGGK